MRCGHLQLPFGSGNWAPHHSQTGTALATYGQGTLIPPPLGVSDGAGGLPGLRSKFVPEEERERSTRVGSFTNTLRPLPFNKPRANQRSLRTARTAGIPKSLLQRCILQGHQGTRAKLGIHQHSMTRTRHVMCRDGIRNVPE